MMRGGPARNLRTEQTSVGHPDRTTTGHHPSSVPAMIRGASTGATPSMASTAARLLAPRTSNSASEQQPSHALPLSAAQNLQSHKNISPLHILCACDTFKGTLPSDEAGEAAEKGIWRALKTKQSEGASLRPNALPAVTVPPREGWADGSSPQPSTAPLAAVRHLHRLLGPLSETAGQYLPPGSAAASPVLRYSPHSTPLSSSTANAKSVPLAGNTHSSLAPPPSPLPLNHASNLGLEAAIQFSHTPMSDGGAGLLDSVTYAATRAAAMAAAHKLETPPAAAPDDMLRLERIFVPPTVPITGPLGTPIEVSGAINDPKAQATRAVSFACDVARRILVVEMAEAAGLPRIARPQDRHPGRTTSYGVGELIHYALAYMANAQSSAAAVGDGAALPTGDKKSQMRVGVRLFLGIGGSSTNEGGLGALQALGLDIFVDAAHARATTHAKAEESGISKDEGGVPADEQEEALLRRPFCGDDLAHLTRVCVSERMEQIFPYLKAAAPSEVTKPSDAPADGRLSCFIEEVCLICDVDNTLVGPRGATYVFGPQKCAPPPPPSSVPPSDSPKRSAGNPASAEAKEAKSGGVTDDQAGEDTAVGVVTSSAQQQLLDRLEAGMCHAAKGVVASTWRQLVPSCALPAMRLRALAAAEAMPAAAAKEVADVDVAKVQDGRAGEVIVRADLLYQPGGGGAGGMSGFFRYLVKACYVPGADMVAGLLGLYETPRVARLLGTADGAAAPSADMPTMEGRVRREEEVSQEDASGARGPLTGVQADWLRCPRGFLFDVCDVVVSGEGSFDDQTILSHKTVGRLLEMTTIANAFRLWRHYCNDPVASTEATRLTTAGGASEATGKARLITDFLIVCGRCGFDAYAPCQAALRQAVCTTLLGQLSPRNGPSSTSIKKEAPPTENEDTARLQLYLEAILQSERFRRVHGEGDALDAARLLSTYCMPQVTVLPLTPTLFPITAAMRQTYACVEAAVARLMGSEEVFPVSSENASRL